jgi:hypothetical protein
MLQAEKVADSRPNEKNKFVLNLPNPSSRTRPWVLLSLQQKWVPEIEE